MKVGYPDTKNKQGGGDSPLLGRYKKRHGHSRVSAKGAGRLWGRIKKGVNKVKSNFKSGSDATSGAE